MKVKWFSKTIWFNVLALVVMVATLFGYTGQIAPGDEFAAKAQEAIRALGPFIVILGNIVLRFFTREPLIRAE